MDKNEQKPFMSKTHLIVAGVILAANIAAAIYLGHFFPERETGWVRGLQVGLFWSVGYLIVAYVITAISRRRNDEADK